MGSCAASIPTVPLRRRAAPRAATWGAVPRAFRLSLCEEGRRHVRRLGELCREHSDCPSAKKGGATCGDLGWMSLEDMSNLGGNFREKCDPLKPGQWSDICGSDQGIHLVQRVA